MQKVDKLGLIAIAAVVAVVIGAAAMHGQRRGEWQASTAEVVGFGGASGRQGSVNVYLRNATGYGVIQGIRPDQLNCRIGQKVAVEQSGVTLRGQVGTCRTAPKLPGQPF